MHINIITYIYIYIYIYTYYIYIYFAIYIYMHIHIYIYLSLSLHVYIYIYIHICVYIYIYTSIHRGGRGDAVEAAAGRVEAAGRRPVEGVQPRGTANLFTLCYMILDVGGFDHGVRQISLLDHPYLRFVDSDFRGLSLWTCEFHPLRLMFCLSQTL